MVVEICATSVESAINAERGGADRIELCSELGVGGITPSYGLIQHVLAKTNIPIFVLIRPRSGNFVYSDEEFELMKMDIEICKNLGCKGIVSGVLHEDFSIDIERTSELIQLSKPLEFTFHRAFDLSPNPFESLEKLIKLGVNRLLTSGQETSVEKGLNLLIQLKSQASDKIKIMPGGGINPSNLHLFREKGFKEIHASASSVWKENQKPKISMNSQKFMDESKQYISDEQIINEIVQIAKN